MAPHIGGDSVGLRLWYQFQPARLLESRERMKLYRVTLNYDTSGVIGQGEGMDEGAAMTTGDYT